MIINKKVFSSQIGYTLGGMTKDQSHDAIKYLTERRLVASDDENPGFEKMLSFFDTEDSCMKNDKHRYGIYVYTHVGLYPNSPMLRTYGNYDPTTYSVADMYIKFRENEKKLEQLVKDIIAEFGLE